MDADFRNLMAELAELGTELPLTDPNVDHDDMDMDYEDEDYEEDDDEEDDEEEEDTHSVRVTRPSQEFESGRSGKGKEIDNSKGDRTAPLKGDCDEEQGELSGREVDGLLCPICYEAWSSGGDHHICCLPCGHIYGLSCIKKWLRCHRSRKCPQCKKRCRLKDIRLLYATQLVAVDGELQQTVKSLEAKCASLEKQRAEWSKKDSAWSKKDTEWFKKETEWKNKEADLSQLIRYLEERTRELEVLLENEKRRASGSSASSWNSQEKSVLGNDAIPNFHMQGCSNKFKQQKDFQIDGARLFDIDSSSEIYVIARRLPGMGGRHVLTKVRLLFSHGKEDIFLPEDTKPVKDLRVSPHARLVLVASLGKKLSVLSTEGNNTVLTYNLPAAAWSCSWDICNPHYLYAGLQNGTVLQFDKRYTMRHVESLNGLTCNPIHSLCSLSPDSSLGSGINTVLTASSLGLCQWNFGLNQERPYLVPGSDKQGVCISLAHCKSSDDIVASYRPKIEMPDRANTSQPPLTVLGEGTLGSHVLYRKMGPTYQKLGATCANVSDIRLPKSAIIDGVYQNPVFVSGDESTCELVLHELPSLMAIGRLKTRNNLIRDVKYTRHLDSGLLSCLSEDSLQLFTAKLL